MGFFVILLAMNMGPKAVPVQGGVKGDQDSGLDPTMEAILSIRENFHNPPSEDNPADAELIRYKKWRDGEADQEGIHGRNESVQAIKPTDFKNITASIPFDDRSVLLSTNGRKTLAEVAGKLRDQRWIIELRGHVSPFESMRDNTRAMDMSHDRAKAVAQALVEAGLKWENLRLVACGSNERVTVRTYDPQADRTNQRVEIVVTNETVAPDPYALDANPSPKQEPGPEAAAHESTEAGPPAPPAQ
jgi:outer membrane protein OmpA-like peptidoglycan-associated protein